MRKRGWFECLEHTWKPSIILVFYLENPPHPQAKREFVLHPLFNNGQHVNLRCSNWF